jgi:biotin transporter BioY
MTLGLVVGAFLLAGWVDARVGDSRPESPVRRIGHVLVGLVVLEASVGVLYLVQAAGAPEAAFMVAVLGVFLPALVYSLLTALWLLRTLAEIARVARH